MYGFFALLIRLIWQLLRKCHLRQCIEGKFFQVIRNVQLFFYEIEKKMKIVARVPQIFFFNIGKYRTLLRCHSTN